MKYRILFFIVLGFFLSSACIDYRSTNIRAVAKLRQQLLEEKYDEIYGGASNITRTEINQEDFVERIKTAGAELKDIDPELRWSRVEGSPEPAVYSDENWSSLDLERNGRKANIQLDWDSAFELCGLLISGDIPEKGNRVFRNCD